MKQRQRFSSVQRREYAKPMVDEGYSNQEVEESIQYSRAM